MWGSIEEMIKRKKREKSGKPAPAADPCGSDPSRGAALVICVDDEKSVLASLQRLLRAESYEFLTTDDAEQALDWVRTGEVDMIIADCRMPKMSGTTLLQMVKATSPSTARIMLTGFAGDPQVLAGKDNQLMLVCTKPWNDEELKRTIRERLLDRR